MERSFLLSHFCFLLFPPMSHSTQPLQPHHGEITHSEAPTVTVTEAFLEKNFRKIVIAGVAALVLVCLIGVFKYKSVTTARESGELVTAAKTPEDCDIIIQKYSGSTAAGNALLMKADLLWKQNKKDGAFGAWREFATKFTKHPFYQSGLIALASKLEVEGNKAEARAIYERFDKEFPQSPFAPMAKVRLADQAWADGKDDDAKKILAEIPVKYPGSPFFEQHEQRQKWITAALPNKEVDGPPKPKETSPALPPGMPPTTGGVKPIQLDAQLGGTTVTPGGPTTVPIKIEPAKSPATTPPPAITIDGKPATLTPPPAPAAPSAIVTPQGTAVTNPAIQITPTTPPPAPQMKIPDAKLDVPPPNATAPAGAPAETAPVTPSSEPKPPVPPTPVPPAPEKK